MKLNTFDLISSTMISFLANKPQMHIPYPDADRLAAIASLPAIRAILPPELVGEASAAATRQHGMARFTGQTVDAFKQLMLRRGVLLIPIGLALLLVGLLIHGLQSKPIFTSSTRAAPTG